MFGLGPTEIIIVAAIILVLFGAKKIPSVMRGLGQGFRELRNGITETADALDEE